LVVGAYWEKLRRGQTPWFRVRRYPRTVAKERCNEKSLAQIAIKSEENQLNLHFLAGRLNITKLGAPDRATTTSGHPSPFRSPGAMP